MREVMIDLNLPALPLLLHFIQSFYGGQTFNLHLRQILPATPSFFKTVKGGEEKMGWTLINK